MQCVKCQAALAENMQFCPFCGTAVSLAPATGETTDGVSASAVVMQKKSLRWAIALLALLLLSALGYFGWRMCVPGSIPLLYKVGDEIQAANLGTRSVYGVSRVTEVLQENESTVLHVEFVDSTSWMPGMSPVPTLKYGNGMVLANFLPGLSLQPTEAFIPIVVYPGRKTKGQPFDFEMNNDRLKVTVSSSWERIAETSERCIKTTLVMARANDMGSGEGQGANQVSIAIYYSLRKGLVKTVPAGDHARGMTVHYLTPPIKDIDAYALRLGIKREITSAEKVTTTNRIRELAVNIQTYVVEKGRFPTSAEFKALPGDESTRISVATRKPFTYNIGLSGKRLSDIAKPAETVLVYDEEADGQRYVAFVDCHIEQVSQEGWDRVMPH